jgi:ABC-type transport system involved in cytochrome bd biosynthesis fused ATPase/permease subunit
MAQEAAADHLQDHQERDKPERGRTLRTLGRLADVVNRQSTTEKADDDMRAVLASITVIAFIGPSGTGKSTHATESPASTRSRLSSTTGC